jgi:hypothetical protein
MTRAAALAPAVLLMAVHPVIAAELRPATLRAWNVYVARAEAHLHESTPAEIRGASIDVPDGTIHHWRGSTIVRRSTVDRVVKALMYPGTPPRQEDVLESRVLARRDNSLRVYLKLARSAIITIVYDTEHDVTFHRRSDTLATSRSVSTRIAEVGGGDRGFLWRLNSYWRYSQVGPDVRIDMESISLSRDVPRLVRSVANPIANRIARESVSRTLESVRRFLQI